MQLYSYYRSTAAYRVRIALELKGFDYTIVPINLAAGEQRDAAYLKTNPQGLVPALAIDDDTVLTQSMAILEWIEETHKQPPLYSENPVLRASQRAFCQHIACDIHPLNNLRVLNYLSGDLELSPDQRSAWYAHWVQRGFTPLEREVACWDSDYSLGTSPGMLEVVLVPQMYNARRFNVDVGAFPALCELDRRCCEQPAFAAAHPDSQPDAPER